MRWGFWLRKFCSSCLPQSSKHDELASLIRACDSLQHAKRLQDAVAGHGRFFDNLVVEMYARCGCLVDAVAAFEKIHDKNVYSWTILITAFAQNGHLQQALQAFKRMDHEGVSPNKVTYISVTSVCSKASDLVNGRQLHSRICAAGLDRDTVLGTALMRMYSNAGCLETAWSLFLKLGNARNVASWTVMITAFAQQGDLQKCIDLYREMDVLPNEVTFVVLLSACSSGQGSCLQFGKEIHAAVAKTKFIAHFLVRNALLNMYAKCGCLEDARDVFDDSLEHRTVVTWNTMIAAYGQMGHTRESFQLFWRMLHDGYRADKVTYLSLLEACDQDVVRGRQLHEMMKNEDVMLDVVLSNSLLNMYAKGACPVEAQAVFDGMEIRSLISWNILISVYTRSGRDVEALELFWRVENEGIKANSVTFLAVIEACGNATDLARCRMIHHRAEHEFFVDAEAGMLVGNALIHMYSKCMMPEAAKEVFDKMQNRNTCSWNTVISACAQGGRAEEAIALFKKMNVEGFAPDGRTYISILEACSSSKAYGGEIHKCLEADASERDPMVESALMSMYAKSGDHREAMRVFENASDRGLLDMVSWTTLVTACALNGLEVESVGVLREMQNQGLHLDGMVFCTLISACARRGLISYARDCFLAMVSDHGIAPKREHLAGLVDVLGRAGWLDEAESLILECPALASWPLPWLTLLAACEVHRNADKGFKAAKHALELGVKSSLCYATLCKLSVQDS